ncbi:hypothetical protein Q4Q35_06100 [Flavivirga aquimarina]|uniref:DUF4890 domain-containing protein n=1 Tax=Flavivirga aquimarina TaxID=2027862 RepID=A0ABT8W8J3_9FLAO|nr:hypothetical protein [Flavivirga aquimarina]MDO5969372.1 hypothetical protein [Flavivirga aquimarina]
MKFVNKIKLLMLGIFISIMGLGAQEDILKESLTVEQTKLMEEQRNLIKANREAFKASLTNEQLTILENATLSKQERREALILTFTEAQKNLLEENRVKVNRLKEQFKATLTTEQRQRIRTRAKTRSGENRNKLRESVKRDRIIKRKQRNNG